MNISTKRLLAYLAGGILLSAVGSLLIGSYLASSWSAEIRNREIEFIFGAIESGPLAISRLQSSAIAGDQLKKLMSNSVLENRGIVSVSIMGGEGERFQFANWSGVANVGSGCILETSRKYNYEDSLNPFVVKISTNKCEVLSEKKAIYKYALLASVFEALIAIGLLLAAMFPAAMSIRSAEKYLSNGFKGELDLIPLIPIRSLIAKAAESFKFERRAALAEISEQVAHDIRSPLSVLSMLSASLNELPDEKRMLIKKATQRITDIANELLHSGRQLREGGNSLSQVSFEKSNGGLELFVLSHLIRELVAEKRIEFKESENIIIAMFDSDVNKSSVLCNRSDLSRVLSNLINNAVDALGKNGGEVKVEMFENGETLEILIRDNGSGIPENIIARLGNERVSFGKTGTNAGNGLGVFQAKKFINELGGNLRIRSRLNYGTDVEISLKGHRNKNLT
jgi:signal transduction histidine kinase